MLKLVGKRVLAVAAVLVAATLGQSARASLIPVYIPSSPGDTTFHYTVSFSSTSEQLQPGDYVTLYDVALPGTLSALAPANWTATSQATGTTPSALAGAAGALDNPAITNVTFTYTGAAQSTSFDTTGFAITVPGGAGLAHTGTFVSTDHLTLNPGSLAQVGQVVLPALVPEPMTAGVAIAALGLFGLRRRSVR